MQELEDGIRRMALLVRQQLTDSLGALTNGDAKSAEAVVERDDVVDSLNRHLEERSFFLFRDSTGILQERRIRSALRVVLNLERIGDAACHIAKHSLMLAQEGGSSLPVVFDDLAEIALIGLDESVQSFLDSDVELAKVACHREEELDEVYAQRLEEVTRLIDSGYAHGATLLHVLAVLEYLEKVCDFVLNIGETTVYAHLGARLTYPQFRQLESLLPTEGEVPVRRHFWDGISGATVLELGQGGQRLVFKEGYGPKLQDDFDRSIQWEQVAPANAARVLAVSQTRGRSGIVREFAEGSLLLDVLLSDAHNEVKESLMRQVGDVLSDVWKTTITPGAPRLEYTSQMRVRLRDALRRHPKLEKVTRAELEGFGGMFDLLTQIEGREAWLAPPFSIWTHGDLNANNIVTDTASNSVIFIDVHRSQYGDYLQDVDTLTASSMRRFAKGKVAKGVTRANEVLFDIAEEFANRNGDRHFRTRLRLARARTFISSARLEADYERAERLFIEGLDSLKRVARRLRVARSA